VLHFAVRGGRRCILGGLGLFPSQPSAGPTARGNLLLPPPRRRPFLLPDISASRAAPPAPAPAWSSPPSPALYHQDPRRDGLSAADPLRVTGLRARGGPEPLRREGSRGRRKARGCRSRGRRAPPCRGGAWPPRWRHRAWSGVGEGEVGARSGRCALLPRRGPRLRVVPTTVGGSPTPPSLRRAPRQRGRRLAADCNLGFKKPVQ
jgi:hypothetical protein